ncbi:MAG: dockerin type I repeat-containing protein [Spirochaetales bacterium]|nr:dockerin type I repeat-containing protein [Spirochaetales bacterium]
MKKIRNLIIFSLIITFFANINFVYCQTEYNLTIQVKPYDPSVSDVRGAVWINPPRTTVELDTQLTFEAGTQLYISAGVATVDIMCSYGEGIIYYTFASWGGDWPNDVNESSGSIVMDSDKTLIVYYNEERNCPTAPPAETPDITSAPTSPPTPIVTPASTNPPDQLGDANGDTVINIVDALLIAQYYVGLEPEYFILPNVDVNCDGSIDILDALLVAQFYVELISEFSGCTQNEYTLTVEVEGRDPNIPNSDGMVFIDPPNDHIVAAASYTYEEGTVVRAYSLGSTPPPPGLLWQSASFEFEGVAGSTFSFVMDRDRVIKVIFRTY